MIQKAKQELMSLMSAAYARASEKNDLPAGAELKGSIEQPRDPSHGDYACGYAMAMAKPLGMKPRDIAEILCRELALGGSYFKSAEVAGAGFINLRLSDKWYGEVLAAVEAGGDKYGAVDAGQGKRVMMEFVSANPTGTMTIGNARGGVVGDTMASILERVGYDVWREFYINDAGNQVELFGKSLEARYMQLVAGEDSWKLPEDGYHGEDIRELAREFYGINGDSFKDMDSQERCGMLRDYGLERNIGKMHADLERYGIRYDRWFNESDLHKNGDVAETIELLEKSGCTYEKDGALWFKLTELGAEKDEVLRRSNGLYTYFAVDLAYHRDKLVKRGFDTVIDVLGADHHGHAIRFKAGLPALDIDKDRLQFIIYQLVRLVRDGETVKVSKRTGKAITLSDLLDEISVDAVRFFFNARPDAHLEFDMSLAVRQDSENPVYYVQYAHARICSLIANLAEAGHSVKSASEIDVSLLGDELSQALIKQISQLPEEIRTSAKELDPSRINRYVTELATRFHRFYTANRIKGEAEDVLDARLKLAHTACEVIANSLSLLGVSSPNRM